MKKSKAFAWQTKAGVFTIRADANGWRIHFNGQISARYLSPQHALDDLVMGQADTDLDVRAEQLAIPDCIEDWEA